MLCFFTGCLTEYQRFFLLEQSKPTVNIPNEPTTIEAQDFSSVTLTIGDNVTALASTNITIKCQASGAPIPLVTWSKDKKKLSNGDRHTVQVNGSLLLIIGSKIEDSARYTCTAESVAGKESASSTVQVVGEQTWFKISFQVYYVL